MHGAATRPCTTCCTQTASEPTKVISGAEGASLIPNPYFPEVVSVSARHLLDTVDEREDEVSSGLNCCS